MHEKLFGEANNYIASLRSALGGGLKGLKSPCGVTWLSRASPVHKQDLGLLRSEKVKFGLIMYSLLTNCT